MACFIESIVAAGALTAAKKKIVKAESQANPQEVSTQGIPWSRKIGWLINMFWGGIFLLLIEHIWHGEIVLFPPFLTAMGSPEDTQVMLYEILTIGSAQVALIFVVWIAMVLFVDKVYARSNSQVRVA